MRLNSLLVRNSCQLLFATAATLMLTTGVGLAKKPGGGGGGSTSLSVTFEDVDVILYGINMGIPGIYSDGLGAYIDRVDGVAAITGDGFRLDTDVPRKNNPPVRFISFDSDRDGTQDALTSIDMRLDREYYADAGGDLTDANGNLVSVADRATKTSRMVPKDMSPNSVARAALFVRFDTIDELDGTVHHWRFVYGDFQPYESKPDAVPVWIFAGPDNGSGEPLDWRIIGTHGALYELVPENPNRKNSALIPFFREYLDLPVEMLLERLP